MDIKLHEIKVKDLVEGYVDLGEEGVTGYGGKLDIRPPYQREFIYDENQRKAVIETIMNDRPLNVMYWSINDNDKKKKFEIIDGQQRTVSICQYIKGAFSVDMLYFDNLEDDIRDKIYNYKLMIYQCKGTDSEKLEWFKIINIAGEKLEPQELRNAVYHGSWVSDAKRYFSKTGCAAYGMASNYITGSPIRQNYLEAAIKWISHDNIENYMGKHQHEENAEELWEEFKKIIDWIKKTFVTTRSDMKSVDWGRLYRNYYNKELNPDEIEQKIKDLILDDDVTNNKGIYSYVLTKDESDLNIRAFTQKMKQKIYELQEHKCKKCNKEFELKQMEADHITPWHEGGETIEGNCQMLCKPCNRTKSGK